MAKHSTMLGFCHNDLQYGNMLLHTASYRSLSMDSMASLHSVDRALRGASPPPPGASPPPRGASPSGGRRWGARGASPEPEGCAQQKPSPDPDFLSTTAEPRARGSTRHAKVATCAVLDRHLNVTKSCISKGPHQHMS